jgi:hypothetical protein
VVEVAPVPALAEALARRRWCRGARGARCTHPHRRKEGEIHLLLQSSTQSIQLVLTEEKGGGVQGQRMTSLAVSQVLLLLMRLTIVAAVAANAIAAATVVLVVAVANCSSAPSAFVSACGTWL